MSLHFSHHAYVRAAQRNVSIDEMQFIIEHGHKTRGTGVIFHQLLYKCLPEDLPANHRYRRLIGTTVVTCSSKLEVITVYRNESAFKKDRRKTKYNTGKGRYLFP